MGVQGQGVFFTKATLQDTRSLAVCRDGKSVVGMMIEYLNWRVESVGSWEPDGEVETIFEAERSGCLGAVMFRWNSDLGHRRIAEVAAVECAGPSTANVTYCREVSYCH